MTSTSIPAAVATADKDERKLADKWGSELIRAGWVALPTTILRWQKHLGLSPLDVNIILALCSHWYETGNLPRPSKKTLAISMNVTPRTIQRHIKALEAKDYIKRKPRGPGSTNYYDPAGLIKEATKYAEQELAVRATRKRFDLRKLLAAPVTTPPAVPVATPAAIA